MLTLYRYTYIGCASAYVYTIYVHTYIYIYIIHSFIHTCLHISEYYIHTGCASGQVLLYDLGPAKARIAKRASAGSVPADAGALKEEASKIVKHVMASSIGVRMCSPP
jgi:hypothetical protein